MQKPPKQYKPQYLAQRCPVCAGRGRVNWGKEECKACNGLGYLKVPPAEGGEEEGGGHVKQENNR